MALVLKKFFAKSKLSHQKIHQYFEEFIRTLSPLEETAINVLYLKNLTMIKSGIIVSNEQPTVSNILDDFNKIFKSKKNFSNWMKIKSYFFRAKMLLLFIISSYEFVSSISPENLKNDDWIIIAKILSNSNPDLLKYKWFTFLDSSLTKSKWSKSQDEILFKLMEEFYPCFFNPKLDINEYRKKIKWSMIAFKLNINAYLPKDFKNYKQCKERWNNHLNPLTNKNSWSLADDIKLLEENLISPKKWSIISKNFPDRTQHNIKNRFIVLISNELNMKREKTRQLLNQKDILGIIKKALEGLTIEKKIELNESIIENDDSFEIAVNYLFVKEDNEDGFLSEITQMLQ